MSDSHENTWDKLLQIKTTGRDDSNSDQYHYPYEPTPYIVLERLANSGLIRKKDVVLDYGCGKGRVDGLELYDEISCDDLFEGCNERERIMIFTLQENLF